VTLNVDKMRANVTADFGHRKFTDFLSHQVRLVRQSSTRLKHSWTLQIGQTADHTIEIEKKWRYSKFITVTVDGKTLIEAKGEDIDCRPDHWECKFNFMGERVLEFDVHETNMDGTPLDSKACTWTKKKYKHECSIVVSNDKDLSQAEFIVDGKPFSQLTESRQGQQEPPLSMAPEVFRQTYGITVPYKVNYDAPRTGVGTAFNISAWAESFAPAGAAGSYPVKPNQQGGFMQLLQCCYGIPPGNSDMQVQEYAGPGSCSWDMH